MSAEDELVRLLRQQSKVYESPLVTKVARILRAVNKVVLENKGTVIVTTSGKDPRDTAFSLSWEGEQTKSIEEPYNGFSFSVDPFNLSVGMQTNRESGFL